MAKEPKKPKKPRKTRAEQISEWMAITWTPSTKGTGATYLNRRGYHVAVWKDDEHPGEWTWHIESNKEGDSYEDYGNRISSEPKAKEKVLNKLADKLGLM